jgi:radical SAM protein with 4Fe4S-binding SPASM domain
MKSQLLHKLTATKKLFTPGPQKPVYLLNFVTNSCNAACEHCFYWKELNTNKKLELTVEEHSKIAQSLGSMFQITFTGGSPELRKDLPEIVYEYYKYCRPGQMTFCMLGYHTDRIIQHTEKILTQCVNQQVSIAISLDGIGEEHDSYRKLDGLFKRVVDTIQKLHLLKSKYKNLRISVGMVVHGLNLHKVQDSAIWVRNNLPIDILKPILVRGNPLNPDTRNDECINLYDDIVDRDRQWLMDHTDRKLNATDIIIRAKENVQRELIKKISSSNTSTLVCSGARETAVMYPSGDIAGCELRKDILGNVREYKYDFSKIWFSKNAFQFRSSSGESDECIGCYHHCFISPAIFRTPSFWPKITKSILDLNR